MSHTATVVWSETVHYETEVEIDEGELNTWLAEHYTELVGTPMTALPVDVFEHFFVDREDWPGMLGDHGTEIGNTAPDVHELRWAP